MISKIKVNFNFNELEKNVSKLVEQYVSDTSHEVVDFSKEYIRSGRVTPDILESTKKRRKRAGLPESPPLFATGKLHDSIKSVKGNIQFLEYGKYHQFERNTRHKNWQKRDFIIFSQSKKSFRKLIESMNKALQIKSPLVLKL